MCGHHTPLEVILVVSGDRKEREMTSQEFIGGGQDFSGQRTSQSGFGPDEFFSGWEEFGEDDFPEPQFADPESQS